MKSTQKSLLLSGLSLLICATMLIGTTFAWFTDSVTNTGNTIKAGELKVGFQYRTLNSQDEYQDVPETAGDMGKLFSNQLWEPGYANGLDLKVVNNGSLALKWQLYFSNIVNTDATNDGNVSNIADVLDVYMIGAEDGATALTDANKLGTLSSLKDGFVVGDVLSTKGEEKTFSIVLKMQETAGNTYQKCSVAFDVELRAMQAVYEEDGFGNKQYDSTADGTPDNNWNAVISGNAVASKPADGWAETTTLAMNGMQVEVPKDAIDESSLEITLTVVPAAKPTGITVDSNELAVSYDITVDGLAENNSVEIPVYLYIGKGLNNVEIYHKTALIASDYDANTGYVAFKTASFSPFTVVYEDGSTCVSTESALQAALNEGGRIRLTEDIELSQALIVPEGISVILDLNKKTLRLPDGNINYDLILSEGNLTLKNGTIINEISNSITDEFPGGNAAVRCLKGTLVMEDCVVSNRSGINSGHYCVTIAQQATADITRCTINGDRGGLAIEDDAFAYVEDCTITAAYYYPLYVYGNGNSIIKDSTFVKIPKLDTQAGNGGNALIYNGIDPSYNDQGTVTLIGCTFHSTRESGSQLEIFNYFYRFEFEDCIYDNVTTNF